MCCVLKSSKITGSTNTSCYHSKIEESFIEWPHGRPQFMSLPHEQASITTPVRNVFYLVCKCHTLEDSQAKTAGVVWPSPVVSVSSCVDGGCILHVVLGYMSVVEPKHTNQNNYDYRLKDVSTHINCSGSVQAKM